LFAKLPDAGRVYLEQMMYSTYCSTLRDDKTLSETEKSKRISEYNREVRRAITAKKTTKTGSKKPLAKNALAGEPKNLPSGPPAEKSIVVTSQGQTGGITAQAVTINKVVKGESSKIEDIGCGKIAAMQDCPLAIDVYGWPFLHQKGLNINGIIWEDKYSDVRITLTSKSLARIHNISLVLWPETHVRKAVQVTNNSGIIIIPDQGPFKEIAIPIESEGKIVGELLPTAGEYIVHKVRIQGSELLGNGEIKIAMACVALNSPIGGECPGTLFGPKRAPKWLRISGTYETTEGSSHKRFHIEEEFKLNK